MDSNQINHSDSSMEVINNTHTKITPSQQRAITRQEMRILLTSTYTTPKRAMVNTIKTINCNSPVLSMWNSDCHDRFLNVVTQIGGIDKATPEGVFNLLNNDDHVRLGLDEIAHQLYMRRAYFKKMEGSPPEKAQTTRWMPDRIKRCTKVVVQLGGINKASVGAVLEAMKKHDDDSCVTIDDIALRLYHYRPLFKLMEEKQGFGPVRNRVSASLVQSRPYGQALVGPNTGSTMNRFDSSWTLSQHKSFVDAVEKLGGIDRAMPKEIMEVMKEEGVTIENVERHLRGLRQLLRGTELLPFLGLSQLFSVNGTNGIAPVPNTGTPVNDPAGCSNSGSYKDTLNKFNGLSLKPTEG